VLAILPTKRVRVSFGGKPEKISFIDLNLRVLSRGLNLTYPAPVLSSEGRFVARMSAAKSGISSPRPQVPRISLRSPGYEKIFCGT
jgi:hypothetical protein